MKTILYFFKSHKKINGTLFYCFEYFLEAKKIDSDIKYIIYNISEEDLRIVKEIFIEKYLFNYKYLDDVISINSIKVLYELETQKNLILDLHTFEKLYSFIRSDIICYSNESHLMKRSEIKKITYYGFYDYQCFDYKVHLKLNFNAFKPIKDPESDSLLISSRLYNYKEIKIPDELKQLKTLTKHESFHHKNMHELFDTLYYFHSAQDTNNRLIPECFFYNKKIHIEFNGVYNDSVYFRYTDILKNGLSNYRLDSSDIMLQAFLN